MAKNKPSPLAVQRKHQQVVNAFAVLSGSEHFSWWAVGSTTALILMAGWFPDGWFELCAAGTHVQGFLKLLFSFAIFGGFWFALSMKFDKKTDFKVSKKTPDQTRLLSILLSPPKAENEEQTIQALKEENLEMSFFDQGRNNWKMPLLAIHHHQPLLDELYVVTSSGEKGSHNSFETFRQVVTRFYPKIKVTELFPEGIDFTNIETTFHLLDKELIDAVSEGADYEISDLTIDLTGGFATTSIAAAMLTFVEGRAFQYIGNDYKVQLYDIVPVE